MNTKILFVKNIKIKHIVTNITIGAILKNIELGQRSLLYK